MAGRRVGTAERRRVAGRSRALATRLRYEAELEPETLSVPAATLQRIADDLRDPASPPRLRRSLYLAAKLVPGSNTSARRSIRWAGAESGSDLAEVDRGDAEAGLSASFISMVETGRNEITVGRLVTMVDFYEVGLSDLIPERDRKQPAVLRRDSRSIVESPDRNVRTPNCSPPGITAT
jgi:hypothetical protein